MQSTLSRASLLALSVFIADVNAFTTRNSALGRPFTAMPSSLYKRTHRGKRGRGVSRERRAGGEGDTARRIRMFYSLFCVSWLARARSFLGRERARGEQFSWPKCPRSLNCSAYEAKLQPQAALWRALCLTVASTISLEHQNHFEGDPRTDNTGEHTLPRSSSRTVTQRYLSFLADMDHALCQ